MTKILAWNGWHDSSWCTLVDGQVEKHVELERIIRTKEPLSNPVHAYMFERDLPLPDVAVSCYPRNMSCDIHTTSVLDAIGIKQVHLYSHHLAHAAHAFYSSQFKDALIFTVDGGGIDDEVGNEITTGVYKGHDNKLEFLGHFPGVNVGCVWSRATRFVFRFESGFPQGCCAGSTMALAAFGDASRFIDETRTWFVGDNHQRVCQAPQGHVKGMSAKDPRSPKHPYLGKWEELAAQSHQNACDIAAALQLATEEYVLSVMLRAGAQNVENVCLSGGVMLNSLLTGKVQEWFTNVKGVFVPPCPYDGGLCLGAAQYHHFHVMDKPRVYVSHSFSPYIGNSYTRQDVDRTLEFYRDWLETWEDDDIYARQAETNVINMLLQQKIVSVFNGRSECGRRALGNRSILADPRSANMKDRVNEQCKHRQPWRPFAPSVLKERVNEWFEGTTDSPYMSFTAHVREDKKSLIPAVIHQDGTSRLQTVEKENSPWYHSFLRRWEQASGVPVLLNTSQNDRTPIVDSPDDAIRCFLGTDIDALYFPEHRIVVTKREGDMR